MTEVVVPEGYQVNLQLTSLTPETKNLMFDSINYPVKSYEEHDERMEEALSVEGALPAATFTDNPPVV